MATATFTLSGRTRGLKVATTAARLAAVAGGRFGTLRLLEVAVDRVRAEYRLAPSAPWQLLGRLRMEVHGNRVDLVFIPAGAA